MRRLLLALTFFTVFAALLWAALLSGDTTLTSAQIPLWQQPGVQRFAAVMLAASALGVVVGNLWRSKSGTATMGKAVDSELNDTRRQLEQVEQDLEHSRQKLAEEETLREQLQGQLDSAAKTQDEHHTIISELEKGLRLADERESQLKKSFDARETEIEALSHELDALSSRHNDTLAQKTTLTQTRDELEHRYTELVAEAADTTAALQTAHEKIARICEEDGELAKLRTRLQQWQPTVDSYRAQLREKTTQIDALRERHELAQAETSEQADLAQQALAAALTEVENLQQLVEESDSRCDKLQHESSRHAERVLALEQQHADETASLEHAQAELERHRHAHLEMTEQFDQLMSLNGDMQTQLDLPAEMAPEETPFEPEQHRERWEADLASIRMHLEPMAQLEASQIAAIDQLHDAHGAVAELTCATEEREAQLDETRTQLANLAREKSTVDERSERQEAALDLAREDQAQTQLLREQLDQQHAHEQTMNARIEQVLVDYKALQQQFDALTTQHDTQTDRALELGEQCDTLEQELTQAQEALQREQDEARDVHEHLQARVSELDLSLANRSEETDELSRRAQDQQAQLEDMQAQFSQLEAEHAALLERSERGLEREAQLTGQLEDTNAQLIALTTQLKEAQELDLSREQEINALSEQRESLDDLNLKLAALGETLSQRERELATLLQSVAKITGEEVDSAAAADRLLDLSRQLDTKDGRIDELSRANLDLRGALRDLQEEAQAGTQLLRAQIERSEQTAQDLTIELEQATLDQRRSADHVARAEALELSLQESQARIKELEVALLDYERRLAERLPRTASGSSSVPLLTRPVGTPPVLTRAVTTDEQEQ